MLRKLFLITLIAAMSVGQAQGQRSNWKTISQKQLPEAEVRFSHGLLPITYDFRFLNFDWDLDIQSITNQYYDLQSYRGNLYSTGALSMAHSVKVAKWLEMGAVLTYVGNFRNIYSSTTNQIIGRENSRSFFFTPTLRFAWFNREWVRMYSSVGLGVGMMIEHPFNLGAPGASRLSEPTIQWGPSIQLTGFGISVGKRLFWFSEVQTFGTLGLFTMGIGYRVVPDKRRWQK